MNLLDLAVLALGSVVILAVFVAKTDIEKSRVRIKVKANRK